jgi:hypothetical protein
MVGSRAVGLGHEAEPLQLDDVRTTRHQITRRQPMSEKDMAQELTPPLFRGVTGLFGQI